MGRMRTSDGVEARKSSIRIKFYYQNKECRETLSVEPTRDNLRRATGYVAEIRQQITDGTFDYAKAFPKSARARGEPELIITGVDTLRTAGSKWIASNGDKAAATLYQYRNALKFWYALPVGIPVAQPLGDRPLLELRETDLLAAIGSIKWSGPGRRNNALIALRGALRFARKDVPSVPDVSEGVKNARLMSTPPDPLSRQEAELVLAHMRTHYDEQVWNYFEFAFFSGMRPEEEIALRWGDWDVGRRLMRVQRARTFKGTEKDPKTYSMRDVELNSRAIAALTRQKKHTFMLAGDIFHNPITGKPWHDGRAQREIYWLPALRKVGIRRRRAYQTRHTYATMMLTGGAKPGWVARQLGHASTKLLWEVYTKWIEGADEGQEIAKVEDWLSRQ